MSNYTRMIKVTAPIEKAFESLTVGLEHWWTKPDSVIQVEGDVAKFRFPPGKSYWTFKASLLVPNSKVVLKCIEALHIHNGQPKGIETEWLNTELVWQLKAHKDGTEVHFEHKGLTSDLLCFQVCEQGWDYFFVDSLKQLLDTGTGKPHQ